MEQPKNPTQIKLVSRGTLASPQIMAIPGVADGTFTYPRTGSKEPQSFFVGETITFTGIPVPTEGNVVVLTVSIRTLGAPASFRKEFAPGSHVENFDLKLAGYGLDSPGSYIWDLVERSGAAQGEKTKVINTGEFRIKASASSYTGLPDSER